MESNNYWERKLSRRRVLATTGTMAGLGALTLVGCGGGGGGGSTSGGEKVTGRLSAPKDTSKDAKRGGLLTYFWGQDETNIDPTTTNRGAGYGGPAAGAYSRLVQEKESVGAPRTPTVVSDLAESWELTDGGLTLNVKLRKDAKFDPRPPTNSRAVDADDVIFSLNRLFSGSPYASQISNKTDPSAPVVSVNKVDQYTLQYKLAFPYAPLMTTLANGVHMIVPREGESQFNLKTDTRGSGAWMLDKYEPSVAFHWRKNPNWYRKDVPYLDGYEMPIITETATRLSQFTAKQLDAYQPAAADLVALVDKFPEMMVYPGEVPTSDLNIAFGSKPGSPFFDARVRRAYSMLVDREAFGTVVNGIDLYKKANVDIPYDLDGHVPAFWKPSGYWIDPRDASKWGDGGKYWQHNVADAKALLAAAGFKDGMEVVANQSNRSHGSPEQAQIITAMLAEGGVKANINVVDYNTVFLPTMWVSGDVKGNYDGFVFGAGNSTSHITTTLYINSHSKGSYPSSRRWDDGQDKIDAMIDASLKELDENKLRDRVTEIQKSLASYMSGFTISSGAAAPRLAWPWVMNYRVFSTSIAAFDAAGNAVSSPPFLFNWIDATKKTS